MRISQAKHSSVSQSAARAAEDSRRVSTNGATATADLERSISDSRAIARQRNLSSRVDQGPMMARQRKQLEAVVAQKVEEDEMLQGRFDPAQKVDEDEMVQGRFPPHQRQVPGTGAQTGAAGLPESVRAGVSALSGLSLDDVRVHRNSGEPEKINALAYTQGSDIHVGPGQEQHLPHEAWHVVQQAQGRVRRTTAANGVPVNDDASLEREADVMGARAVAAGRSAAGKTERQEP